MMRPNVLNLGPLMRRVIGKRSRSGARRLLIGAVLGGLLSLAHLAAAAPGIDHGTNDLTRFPRGTFTLDVEDLRVKVQGGFVRSTRSWSGGAWQFNRRWAPLQILERRSAEARLGEKWAVRRNGSLYLSRRDDDVLLHVRDETRNVVDYGKTIEASATGYVWRDRQGNVITYDTDGVVVSYGDRNGNTVTLERDAAGRVARVLDPNGVRALAYAYEDVSRPDPETGAAQDVQRPVSVTDAFGRSVTYGYDDQGRLVTVTDPLGHSWRYAYAANGFIAGVVDPAGRRLSISIDDDGRISSWENADGVGYRFGYVSSEQGVSQVRTDGEGRVTQTLTNAMGQVVSEVREGETLFRNRYVLSDGTDSFGTVGIATASVGEAIGAVVSAPQSATVRTTFTQQAPVTLRERIVTNQRGFTTRTTLDAFGNALRVTRPDGAVRTTEYHGHYDFPVRRVAVDGVVTEWDYDESGNLTAMREAVGTAAERATGFEYDDHGNVTRIRYVGDDQTAAAEYAFTYDARGNLLTRRDPEGGLERFTDAAHPAHDALGNAPVRMDARGKTWVFAFDAVGNLTQRTDPLGRQAGYGYNQSGDLLMQTAANGGITTYTPNHAGLPVAIEDALGRRTRFAYNRANQLEGITNALGHRVASSYDPLGRLLKSTDANGNETAFEYGDGLLRRVHFPTFRQVLGYDELDRLAAQSEEAEGLATQRRRTEYDRFGSPAASIDALERRSAAEYDALRQRVATTDAIGGVTRFTYDDRGNLLSVTDPEQRTTAYGYDKNDRRVRETRPNGAQWTWAYLANGLPETATNPDGQVTEYGYDDAGQLIRTRFYASAADRTEGTPGKTVHFEYNALGQLTHWDDGTRSATYGYTLAGERATTTVDYGPFTKSHGYTYDAAGRQATYTNPEGVTYRYRYDAAGHFQSLEIPGAGVITVNGYTWYAPNRRTYPGGLTVADVHDPLLRLTGREARDAGDNRVTTTVNAYNVGDQLTALTRDDFATEYRYDALDRLIEDTGNSEAFTYDGVGNRLTAAGDPASWTYGPNHELLATGSATYTYTASGHRKTKVEAGETWTYTYNLEARLVQIDSETAGEIGRYDYDPLGRRLSKTTAAGTRYFHYDDTGLLAEYDASGTLLAEYQYTPGGPWMTDPLFLRDGEGKLHYYVNDHLGTPQRLFTSTGAVTWAAGYASFGGATPWIEEVENRLRFPGQYWDVETGSHYNFFRDYDPSTGRYIQSDPIGLQGGLNTYGYALQNPVSNIDEYGLEVRFICREVAGVPGAAQHCFVSVTCPSEGINQVLSMFGTRERNSDGYKYSYDPTDVTSAVSEIDWGRDSPTRATQNTFDEAVEPDGCEDKCEYEKSVLARFKTFPPGRVPYSVLGPNSNTFARYLLGGSPLPNGAPADNIRNGAPGIDTPVYKFYR